MKVLMALAIALQLNLVANASIFNDDDRQNAYEIDAEYLKTSEASIALIPKYKLIKVGDYYQVKTKSLIEQFNFCADAKFAQEPQTANCSASLITNQHILTAAHCIDKQWEGYRMQDFYAVFNFKKTDKNQQHYLIKASDVFTLEQEIHYDFDTTMSKTALDLAIYKLSAVTNYRPAKLNFKKIRKSDKVFVLGYPLGVPLKLSNDSEIISVGENKNSFRHQLDTFSVNSGSPIFNEDHEIIGVHVRGTGANRDKYGSECNNWYQGDPHKDYGEANEIKSIQKLYSQIIQK